MSAKAAHCFRDLGDHKRAAGLAIQSLDMAGGYLRGKMFNLCLLASAIVEQDPHEAVRIGTEALDMAGALESRRTHAYLRGLRARLTRYAGLPDVAAFRDRVMLERVN